MNLLTEVSLELVPLTCIAVLELSRNLYILSSAASWLRSAYMSSVLVCGQATTVFSAQVFLSGSWLSLALIALVDGLLGTKFKATDFREGDSSLPPLKPAEKGEGVGVKKKCLKPSRRFVKASDEPRCSTQTPQRPIRPRRGIRKQAEPGNSTDKEQELKEWIRVELKTSWTTNHADPTGMEFPKKRRPYSGDGIDEAEKCGSDSKKHKKNNGDGFSEDETMRMHDNHCDGRTPNDRFWEKGEVGVESPISGLNLLAEEVEKGTWSDNVYKDPQENSCRILTVWPHPESYVLPKVRL
ncbi:hypothetical protein Bca52824_001630 [Brassica carinata]|uniref:Uncharacterized protein n=1 Tax=Brassica carinata TaxID=52824 RepID=A0A8X7WKJ8_BRACI|nr:hypothetical protein Bca52824_001630 [Brassica carinata]